ncbi:MAG TPA: cytochrome o ubiquinol oxidase subunit III [Candidatus Dormibacteraeota bacterium]|nr:cytochrome o ubiquinol oxidase subunit III [Candidatus Dormibacteraeota bacterium]
MKEATTDELQHLTHHQQNDAKTVFGFWIYLMTDCVLFASLFAAFAVLRGNTFGGPAGNELFSLPFVLTETLILLTSSFTAGLGLLSARRGDRNRVLMFFGITMLLGIFFLTMELTEFHKLAVEGNSWRRSGFLSAFFTLVGTHGAHITTGLVWMAVMMVSVARRGLNSTTIKRLTMLSMFWHFLDIIWIFIFTIVYLMGVAI